LWSDACCPCELGQPDAFLFQVLEDLRVRRTHVVEPLLREAIENLADERLVRLTELDAQVWATVANRLIT
jgi:hypothetical protein